MPIAQLAYDWGYQKGSNLFGGAGGLNAFGEPDYGAMVNNAALDNLKSIDNNTKAIKKSVDMSDELQAIKPGCPVRAEDCVDNVCNDFAQAQKP